jgi:hypothetical protein
VIDVNLKERHIRGGIATQNKYRLLRMNKWVLCLMLCNNKKTPIF